MSPRPRSLGYAALVAAPAVLLVRAFTAWETHTASGVVAVVAALAAVTAVRESGALRSDDSLALGRSDARSVLAVTAAAGATRLLAVDAALGAVVASAFVGVAAGLTLRNTADAAYCGSFVGMVSTAVTPSLYWVLAAGAVAGGTFVAARGVFDGFGGKLGTTALAGCLVTVGAAGTSPADAAGLPWNEAAVVALVAGVAALATALIGVRYGAGAVLGSALVGLGGGVVLPLVVGGGSDLPAVAFCGSFVGMAAPERVGGWAGYGVAGAASGLVFVVGSPVLPGVGGTLGTTAFLACLAVAGARQVARMGAPSRADTAASDI